MSNFGNDSSVNINQEFFDSGFSYEGQGDSYDNASSYSNTDQSQEQTQGNHYYHYNSNFNTSQTQPIYGAGQSFGSYYEAPAGYSGSAQIDYGFSGSMQAKQTSADYTSFEDEPPLLEGKCKKLDRVDTKLYFGFCLRRETWQHFLHNF